MIKKLMSTRLGAYNVLSVGTDEPVRNYKRTLGVIASRMGFNYVPFLAEPKFSRDGKSVDWYTDAFTSTPQPMSALRGEERAACERRLGAIMDTYRESLPSPDDDAYPLMTRLVIVPDETCVFYADNRVVIVAWGLKPRSESASSLNLLKMARKPDFKPEPHVKAEPAHEPAVPVTDPQPEPNTKPEQVPTPAHKPEPVITAARAETDESKAMKPKPEVQDYKPRKKRAWLKWLLIILALIALGICAWLLFRSCSGAHAETIDQMEPTAPAPKPEAIVPDRDSIGYVASDRLNIRVKKGGDLNEFTAAFRKHYPDAERYKLCSPDTVFKRVMLLCPSNERENLKEDIKKKLPDFELSITEEGVHKSIGRTTDPAMSRTDQSYYFDMVNAVDAWDIERGSDQVVVAVLDGGIDIKHPDLKDKIVDPYDAVSRTSKVPVQPECGGHGTHTCGTVGAQADNNLGACGIAPGCKIMPINVFVGDQAFDNDIIEGVKYAIDHGADIISMSIGRSFTPMVRTLDEAQQRELAQYTDTEEAELWDEVCGYAQDHGVLIVKAAGNENVYTGLDPKNRTGRQLLVSAVDQQGEMAVWDPFFMTQASNWGDDLCTISAPGTDVYNAVPGGFAPMSGTSMACPIVAGGAALLKSHNPALTPAQIKKVLEATANPQPNAPIGPIMDLVAALNADPDNLPDRQPAERRPIGTGNRPSPGIDPLQWIFDQYPGSDPYPTYGFNPLPGQGNPTPANPGPGSQVPFPVPTQDCDVIGQQYRALQQMRDVIDSYIDELRRECPECLQGQAI